MKKIILIACVLFSSLSVADNLKHEMSLAEQGILLVNQKEYKQAKKVLKIASAKGDANATFWLGIAQLKSGKHFDAGKTFLQAAKMGDPWAMSALGGDDGLYFYSPCSYLGWPCDNKWNEKALKGWEILVKQGDPDAIYALTKMKTEWWNFIPYYRIQRALERVEKAIPNGGGYAFLRHYALRESDDERLKYLKIAANQGYAPAMADLFYYKNVIGEEEANKWLNKSLKLGYVHMAESLYTKNVIGANEKKKRDYHKAYYYSLLAEALGGEKEGGDIIF